MNLCLVTVPEGLSQMPVISEVKVCLHGHMKDPKLSSPKQMATNYLEIRI